MKQKTQKADYGSTETINEITGIILAGGRARRMGGIDKGLIDLDGEPMVSHVIRRFQPQVGSIIISANRNLREYSKWATRVVGDKVGEYDGPLAGMASAVSLADTEFAATVPCDSPMLCADLVSRMYRLCTACNAEVAVAHDGDRLQPVFSLMRVTVADSILDFLASGERKIDRWLSECDTVTVDFSDARDSFINVNTEEERLSFLARNKTPRMR